MKHVLDYFVLACVLSVSSSQARTPAELDIGFIFPDQVRMHSFEGDPITAQKYNALVKSMTTLLTESGPADAVAQDRRFRSGLGELAAKAPDESVRIGAERRAVLWEWFTEQIDGRTAGARLTRIASKPQSPGLAQETLAIKSVVLARSGDLPESASVYAQLDHAKTPQLGWYGFEMVKYYANYVHETVDATMRATGMQFPEEHARSLAYAEFLEEVLIPSLNARIDAADALSQLERDQLLVVMEKTSETIQRVLARRLYPDVSQRSTQVTWPLLLQAWERAAELNVGRERVWEDPVQHLQRIHVIRDKIIPSVEFRQQKRRLAQVAPLRLRSVDAQVEATLSDLDKVGMGAGVSGDTLSDVPLDQPLRTRNEAIEQGLASVSDAAPPSRATHRFVVVSAGLVILVLGLVWCLLRRTKQAEGPDM